MTIIGRGPTAADIESLKALGGAGPTGAEGGAAEAPAEDAAAEDVAADEAAANDAAELEGIEGEVPAGRTAEEALALQAWMAVPQPVMAWRVIDQFARIIGGDAVATGPLPSQLLTGATVGTAVLDESGNYIGVADYKEQFRALWGLA